MTPLEKRLKELKELKLAEESLINPAKNYLSDLELSIKECEQLLKTRPKKGYEMVSE